MLFYTGHALEAYFLAQSASRVCFQAAAHVLALVKNTQVWYRLDTRTKRWIRYQSGGGGWGGYPNSIQSYNKWKRLELTLEKIFIGTGKCLHIKRLDCIFVRVDFYYIYTLYFIVFEMKVIFCAKEFK